MSAAISPFCCWKNTVLDLGNIKGDKGDQGEQGLQGEKGDKGDQGEQGLQGEKGDKGDQGVGVSEVAIENDELVITLSNGNVINLGNIKGAKGDKGDKGDIGEQGVSITNVTLTAEGNLSMTFSSGETIPLGNIKGQDGVDGVGIAEVYIEDGNLYVRKTNETVAVNLGSVKGPKGDKGEDGVDGKSAYELYKQAHPEYTGTLEDWLNSLKGETGRGIVKTEISGTNWIIYYTDGTTETHDLSGVAIPADEILIYSLQSDGTYSVKAGKDIAGHPEVIIPATHNGITVTLIEEHAFDGCTTLEKVVIPDTITKIGAYAFNGCTNLNSAINIPSTITVIEEYCFYNCKNIENINIPAAVVRINKYALYNVPSITVEGTNKWNVSNCKGETSTFSNRTLTAESYKDYTVYDSDYWVYYDYYPSSGVWKR